MMTKRDYFAGKQIAVLFILSGFLLIFATRILDSILFSNVKNQLYFCLILTGACFFYIGIFSFFRGPYIKSWAFIRESRRYFYATLLFFIFSAFIGFFLYSNFSFIDSFLKDLLNKTARMNLFDLIDFIFFNNFKVTLLGIFLGIFLGFYSFFNILSNGIVLGYVLHKAWLVSSFWDFWRILPHGIFELTAVFISLGLGLKLGRMSFSFIALFFRHYKKVNKGIYVFVNLLSVFLSIFSSLVFVSSLKMFSNSSGFNALNPLSSQIILYLVFFVFDFLFNLFFITIILLLVDRKFRRVSYFKAMELKQGFYNSMLVLLFVVIPLLIIAAIIEGALIVILG